MTFISRMMLQKSCSINQEPHKKKGKKGKKEIKHSKIKINKKPKY